MVIMYGCWQATDVLKYEGSIPESETVQRVHVILRNNMFNKMEEAKRGFNN